ncbi:hypothetical protein PRIPAC_91433 [Pristionchus pacificus]|uniref:Uncharacterized protein n=1 Tax=Pristionchus pacificus TaxID=54126 RepID=A0A2A6B6S9_PRIPA|nr:hypothetical protein PRIPAC_91433 [Pristionchus pacificus]|eukprot:PDM61585.1 hypothetical protein PRIPAC_51027 [Pristionchus pacificus]
MACADTASDFNSKDYLCIFVSFTSFSTACSDFSVELVHELLYKFQFFDTCYLYVNGTLRLAPSPQVIICPAGQIIKDDIRGYLESINCNAGNMYGTFPNETLFNQTDATGGLFHVNCVTGYHKLKTKISSERAESIP